MRLAYADPPYLGCAWRYPEHPESSRWDDPAAHGDLMARMERDYDGWALSLSAKSLPALLPLAPENTRVAAWLKPYSASSAWKHVRIAYCWEPLIFAPGRANSDKSAPRTKDSFTGLMTFQRPVIGAKPEAFCRWVLDLLGFLEGDTVDDLFPGSGVMGAVARQGVMTVSGED